MSEYDGEIRIKADIETENIDRGLQKLSKKLEIQTKKLGSQTAEVKKLQTEYDNLSNGVTKSKGELGITKEIEKAKKRLEEFKHLYESQQFENASYKSLGKSKPDVIEGIEKYYEAEKEVKKLEENLNKIKSDSIKKIADELKNAAKTEKQLNSELEKTKKKIVNLGNQKTNNFSKKIDEARQAVQKMGKNAESFGNKIWKLAQAAFVFNIISAGFKKIREHIDKLIFQDKQLTNSLNQVKANLLTAFMPIWQAVLPALQALGRALAWVTQHIAAFISMLFGKSVQQGQKSAKNYINTANALDKQAKGYERVGKTAKKAAGEIASFDKIEVLNRENTDAGTGSSSGAGAEIPEIMSGFKDIDISIIDRVREAFECLKEPFKDINLEPIRTQFSKLWGTLQRFNGKIGVGLWWFYENVLVPLGKWTISEVLPRFLNILNKTLEALEPIIDQVGDDLKWLWNEFLKPVGEWAGEKITKFLDLLGLNIEKLGNSIKTNKTLLEFISAFLIGLGAIGAALGLKALAAALWGVVTASWAWTAALLANPITWIIAGIAALTAAVAVLIKHWDEMEQYFGGAWEYFKKTIVNIGDIFEGFVQSLSGWIDLIGGIFTGNWERIWKGAGNIVIGALNMVIGAFNTIGSAIKGVINSIIGGINFLINKLNGSMIKIGVQEIPEMPSLLSGKIPKIPKLSQGAVLEGGNPFLAWVNDQPRGRTNVETPLNTMVEAFKTALSQSPQNDTSFNLKVSGDSAGFFRFLNMELEKEKNRVGQSFVTGDVWV